MSLIGPFDVFYPHNIVCMRVSNASSGIIFPNGDITLTASKTRIFCIVNLLIFTFFECQVFGTIWFLLRLWWHKKLFGQNNLISHFPSLYSTTASGFNVGACFSHKILTSRVSFHSSTTIPLSSSLDTIYLFLLCNEEHLFVISKCY